MQNNPESTMISRASAQIRSGIGHSRSMTCSGACARSSMCWAAVQACSGRSDATARASSAIDRSCAVNCRAAPARASSSSSRPKYTALYGCSLTANAANASICGAAAEDSPAETARTISPVLMRTSAPGSARRSSSTTEPFDNRSSICAARVRSRSHNSSRCKATRHAMRATSQSSADPPSGVSSSRRWSRTAALCAAIPSSAIRFTQICAARSVSLRANASQARSLASVGVNQNSSYTRRWTGSRNSFSAVRTELGSGAGSNGRNPGNSGAERCRPYASGSASPGSPDSRKGLFRYRFSFITEYRNATAAVPASLPGVSIAPAVVSGP